MPSCVCQLTRVCLPVYASLHMYACLCMPAYTCMPSCVCQLTHVCLPVYASLHVYAFLCMPAYTCMPSCVCQLTRVCLPAYTWVSFSQLQSSERALEINIIHRAGAAFSHQVLWTVELVGSGGAAGYQGLKHAAHHHRLHVLSQRLALPRGEVVSEARLV